LAVASCSNFPLVVVVASVCSLLLMEPPCSMLLRRVSRLTRCSYTLSMRLVRLAEKTSSHTFSSAGMLLSPMES
jgi:hypothetical protein